MQRVVADLCLGVCTFYEQRIMSLRKDQTEDSTQLSILKKNLKKNKKQPIGLFLPSLLLLVLLLLRPS